MPKFSGPTMRPAAPTGPLSTTEPIRTFEGGAGSAQDPKTELFTLAVTNMVGETTFYESAGGRDSRFIELIRNVALTDPEWVLSMITWLRGEGNMRSASVVAAVELARATPGSSFGRRAIVAACQRADEPAEALGYWLATYGRKIPMAVKRGIADSAVKLYNERNALKYDGNDRGVRMGDVIELTHPKAQSEWQNTLFKFLLDKRHGHLDDDPAVEGLATISANRQVQATPADERRELLRSGQSVLNEAAFTWESLSGWLPGGMDAEAWEAIIPELGYMALIRNLRNFEQAGVSKVVLDQVSDRIADPDEVARSRQFPFRFFSAYRNVGDRFTYPLAQALEHSTLNIPTLPGKSLVMVDTSGSMQHPISARSTVQRHEVGSLFAASLARNSNVDLAMFATSAAWVPKMESVLRTIQGVSSKIGAVGHGTYIWENTVAAFAEGGGNYDRVMIFTDEQAHDQGDLIPPNVPVYAWDLAGYGRSTVDTSRPGRYLLGGFTDACFRLMALLESGRNADWPWA